jgi:hypothetical protein
LLTGTALLAAPVPKVKPVPRPAPAPAKPAEQFSPEGLEFFEKKIRPILAESCLGCHTAKLSSPMGALKLDSRVFALKGGDRGASVVPGHPDKSLLHKAVTYEDRTLQMPPKGKLPAEQIAALTEWIKMGAPWPAGPETPAAPQAQVFNLKARRDGHWSFQPLKRPAVPVVKNKAWVQSPIDAFILAKLEAKGLAPAAPTDRRTLLRRVTYDLIGLPPTPAEIEAFLNDRSPNAYEKVVNRLLASPQYGERWARHWLDLVRFAETDGHEFDFEKPNAWAYRDYVIRALNADVPYDQFVREHLAGDLLPNPRRHPTEKFNESLIATGFWFLGEGKHSPVDLLEDETERVDNQVDVLSKAFVGLSVGCARCHDHKFDPISTKDYYALTGILKSSRFELADLNDPAPTRQIVAELQKVEARLSPVTLASVGRAGSAQADDWRRYLLAARAVLNPATQVAQGTAAAGDVVFEDFEAGSYEGWTSTGSAFGERPNRQPIPEYQGDVNAMGKGFVNTHSALQGTKREVGDASTGTLTSRPFTIEQPYIRFLVGGGGHEGKTCLNLKVEGKVARTITGKNNNRMDWAQFDVRDLRGKQAQFEIVDAVSGPWGNIGVDQITFTGAPSAETLLVDSVAAREGVSAAVLQGWVRHLREGATKDVTDPLHPLVTLASVLADRFPSAKTELLQKLKATAGVRGGERVFASFNQSGFGEWTASGEAFGEGPTREPVVRLDAKTRQVTAISPSGSADSGRLSDRLQGALRSPNFKIEKPNILYHMAGRDAQVNLIIDNFQRIRYPIYGGLTLQLKGNDRPEWYVQDVGQWVGHTAYIEVVDRSNGYVAVDEVRFSDAGAPAEPANPLLTRMLEDPALTSFDALVAAYGTLFSKMSSDPAGDRDRVALLGWLARTNLSTGTAASSADPEITALLEQREKLEVRLPKPMRVMAAIEGSGEDDQVHIRGRHQTLGDVVPRRFLEAVAGAEQPVVKSGSGRRELAERMVAPTNPLLPRVMVNRVWMHHFGEGLVRTPDDFGLRGEKPTHPELLDYLASSFGNGWSLKRLHRQILLSNTYQMASQGDPKAEAADPQDKLLHRMPVRRLEGEAIRDAILAISGKLDAKMYGPGVLPYLTPFMIGRGRPDASGPIDSEGRRSIYINVRRNFLSPMFLAFDMPIPFTTIGRRSVSTVPAQALTLMNNPFVIQQAGYWGRKALALADLTPRQRIVRMYEEAYARTPVDAEVNAALVFLSEQDKAYGTPNDPRSWGDLAHVLINVKEFIFLN